MIETEVTTFRKEFGCSTPESALLKREIIRTLCSESERCGSSALTEVTGSKNEPRFQVTHIVLASVKEIKFRLFFTSFPFMYLTVTQEVEFENAAINIDDVFTL